MDHFQRYNLNKTGTTESLIKMKTIKFVGLIITDNFIKKYKISRIFSGKFFLNRLIKKIFKYKFNKKIKWNRNFWNLVKITKCKVTIDFDENIFKDKKNINSIIEKKINIKRLGKIKNYQNLLNKNINLDYPLLIEGKTLKLLSKNNVPVGEFGELYILDGSRRIMANLLNGNKENFVYIIDEKFCFPESKMAHKYLDNLKGIEIGGSAHNPFGLNTINVDRYSDDTDTEFASDEIQLYGEKLPVDVVTYGDKLPFADNEYDFVISSHVIEHFFDPISALKEWKRVAKKYIYIIVPHKERTFDKDRNLTSIQELLDRHEGKIPYDDSDKHHSVWNTESFLEHCKYLNFNVIEYQDVDDKAGNGFAVVIEL